MDLIFILYIFNKIYKYDYVGVDLESWQIVTKWMEKEYTEFKIASLVYTEYQQFFATAPV